MSGPEAMPAAGDEADYAFVTYERITNRGAD
jgi:hypothetical protein